MAKGKSANIEKIIYYLILTVISLLLLFPLVYMLANSFMSSNEILRTYTALNPKYTIKEGQLPSIKFNLIPQMVTLMQYYQVLLRKPKFLVMFWNSVILTVPIVVGQVIVGASAAYGFAKLRFPFRDQIFFIYIIVMLMPFQVTLVPNYIMIRKLNIVGQYISVILPGVFATFGVFLLRQFMKNIPDEYCDAAKIDGAGYLRIFVRIILPQVKGGIASLAILIFIDNWNMVEQPLIFLEDFTMHPLSIFLSDINSGDLGLAFACGIIYMMPTVLIFLYGNKYLIEGIQLSGIK